MPLGIFSSVCDPKGCKAEQGKNVEARSKTVKVMTINYRSHWVAPIAGLLAAIAMSIVSPVRGAEWSPSTLFEGRSVDFYDHGVKTEWGYSKPQRDYFIVVAPEHPRPNAPLYVVLHSAGHNGESAFRIASEGIGNHTLYHPPVDFYALFLDCRDNQINDWWWGGPCPTDKEPKNMGGNFSPTERRVEDTVKWVIAKYKIDPERVYLAGISMGGSGSLGIGLRRGDLFAAIMVNVPAGALHVSERMYFPHAQIPDDVKIPDPPVVVSYSGGNDNWSRDQAKFLMGMAERRYALIECWAATGHTASKPAIVAKNDLVFAFPWLEIRKNEAYPAFTHATSDNKDPWLNPTGADDVGQFNAFFRWKNVEDASTSFAMELRLINTDELKTTFAVPDQSTVDVTLRRLQHFKVPPGRACAWHLVRDGKSTAEGTIQPDAEGLLNMPRLTITKQPATLMLKVQ